MTVYKEAETNYAENEADDTSKMAFRFIIGRNQHEENPARNMAPISFAISIGVLIWTKSKNR